MKKRIFLIILTATLLLCGGCNQYTEKDDNKLNEYPDSPAINKSEVLFNEFPSEKDGEIVLLSLDTKNDGYIGACLKKEIDEKVKLSIIKDDKRYNYDVDTLDMVAYPLQMGNGTYLIKVMKQYEGDSYAMVYSKEIKVNMSDEFSVYKYPNQIVNYNHLDSIVDLSFEKTKDDSNDLKRIYSLFVYVLDALDYDNDKAKNVATVYTLPDLEEAIEKGKGICFDYAALLSALCRIQGIPARVIVGYTDIEYHAWCEIYLENEGWINPKLIFASKDWSLIDPTFADSGQDYEGNYDEVYRY